MHSYNVKTKTYSTSDIEVIVVRQQAVSSDTLKRDISGLNRAKFERKYRQEEKSIKSNRPITDQNQYWLQRKRYELF